MFNRRRHSSHSIHLPKHHAQPATTASSAATTAASQAFLNSRGAGNTLSAAAAAAALRANPTTPTAVGDVQTKRMVRKNSTGSVRSSTGSINAEPRRSVSSGSMTERSLRSPSPNRTSLSGKRPEYVPPVPPVPTDSKARDTSPITNRPRASSLDRPPRRFSPVVTGGGGRGSLDVGQRAPNPTHRPLSQAQELSIENSKRLINFSRPISPQNTPQISTPPPQNPPPTATTSIHKRTRQSGWFTGAVVSGGVPRGSEVKRSVPVNPQPASRSQPPAAVPVSPTERAPPNKQSVPSSPVAPIGLASSKWSTPYMHAGTRPFKPQINRPAVEPPPQRVVLQPPGPAKVAATPPPIVLQTPSASSTLKAPEESLSEQKSLSSIATQTSPSASPPPQHLSLEQSKHAPTPQSSETMIPAPVVVSEIVSKNNTRERSISPHNVQISSSPPITINGLRHEPPGRTASPVKSALKQGGRNNSPAGVIVVAEKEPINQATTEAPRKKKSVRISVDVRPGDEIDGIKTSRYAPPTPINLVHSMQSQSFEEDLDDIMQPRPALPSFGSIRGQSSEHGTHENPLMQHPNVNLEDGIHSSDHAIGGILRQSSLAGKGVRRDDEDTAKMVTRKPGDPIPPEVTSVEGSGFNSDSSEESPVRDRSPEPEPSIAEKRDEKPAARVTFQQEPLVEASKAKGLDDAPTMEPARRALTPVPEGKEWYVPGAFPDEDEDHTYTSHQQRPTISFAPIPDHMDESSDDDNSSIYSDAEEEIDGTGFASLDAVLEGSSTMAISAASESFSQQAPERLSKSPETSELEKRLEAARKNREEQEREAAVPIVVEPLAELPTKSKTEETQEIQENHETQKTEEMIQTKETKETKKTTTQQANVPRVTTPEPAPQSSLSSSKWSPASRFHQAVGQMKMLRRNSAQSPTRTTQSKPKSPTRVPEVAPLVIPLRRKDSNDSVSSFQRNRASAPGGRTGLKSSLRSDNQRLPSSPRTLSPNGSFTGQQRSMRTSLRGSASPTRNETKRPKQSRLSSLIKGSRSKAGKAMAPTSGKGQSKFTSRFAHDSDSESEMPARRAFKSRFADDSDDEDLLASPTSPTVPRVRGIPRPSEDDAHSTDLEGENTDSDSPRIPPVPTVEAVNRAHTAQYPPPKSLPEPLAQVQSTPSTAADSGLATSRYASAPTASPMPSSTPRPSHRRWHSMLLFGSSSPVSSSATASPLPQQSSSPQHTRSQSSATTSMTKVARSPTKLRRRTRPDGAPAWPLKGGQQQQQQPEPQPQKREAGAVVAEMGDVDEAAVGATPATAEEPKTAVEKKWSTKDDGLGFDPKEILMDGDDSTTVAKEEMSPPSVVAPSSAIDTGNEKAVVEMSPIPGSEKRKRFGRWKKLIKLG